MVLLSPLSSGPAVKDLKIFNHWMKCYLQCINLELNEVNGEAGIHKHHCKSHQQLKTTGLKRSSVCMKQTVQTLNSHFG